MWIAAFTTLNETFEMHSIHFVICELRIIKMFITYAYYRCRPFSGICDYDYVYVCAVWVYVQTASTSLQRARVRTLSVDCNLTI